MASSGVNALKNAMPRSSFIPRMGRLHENSGPDVTLQHSSSDQRYSHLDGCEFVLRLPFRAVRSLPARLGQPPAHSRLRLAFYLSLVALPFQDTITSA